MIEPPAVPLPPVDWDDWGEALKGFSGATGLCVSAYDGDAVRRVGPHLTTRAASFLDEQGAWAADGAASAIEQALVRDVLASRQPEERGIDGALGVLALPLAARDSAIDARGVVVFGWVFTQFTSALGCQRIARRLAVDGVRLWNEARQDSPVAPWRLAKSQQLLQTLVDSTARHDAALQRLEQLARVREVFLAGVSHELRAPLSALGMRIELLLRGGVEDAAAVRSSLVHMKRHVADEARLVEDLIDASRTRTGQLSVQRRVVELAPIVEAALDSVRPLADAKRVVLQAVALQALRGCRVSGDAQRLTQVFWNLLSNAVKFTPADGSVSLRAAADAGGCEVWVSDSGKGISAEMLPLVFEPFIRQRRGNEQGMGLGLFIAQQVVRLHDGRISAHSAGPGLGTEVHVWLPRA